jgi:hypothetical protein
VEVIEISIQECGTETSRRETKQRNLAGKNGIRDRCYDFLNILAEKFCKKLAFLTQNKAKF